MVRPPAPAPAWPARVRRVLPLVLVLAAAGAVAGVLILARSLSPPGADAEGGGRPAPGADAVQQRAPGSNLEVTLVSCFESGDSVRAGGYVRNNGGVVVRYVEVEVIWRDAGGEPVDTRVTYAIGGEVFTPGDSISFEAATGERSAVGCDASLRNYEPL
ncbi:MAG: FxLYD domain-containing protein [Gammaproteobacteria bacterium]|nr:FxLYD domain-containing protein [Gammaproteobacteria bacterium]MDE0247388.1 FxLYD domain-containing protein [Gammaproteobacteria bacterium]